MTKGIKKNIKKTFLYSHCGLWTVTSFSRIFRGGRASPWLEGGPPPSPSGGYRGGRGGSRPPP